MKLVDKLNIKWPKYKFLLKSSPNRFIDGEDDSTQVYDLEQLKANCERWSLASDLRVFSTNNSIDCSFLNWFNSQFVILTAFITSETIQ